MWPERAMRDSEECKASDDNITYDYLLFTSSKVLLLLLLFVFVLVISCEGFSQRSSTKFNSSFPLHNIFYILYITNVIYIPCIYPTPCTSPTKATFYITNIICIIARQSTGAHCLHISYKTHPMLFTL